MPLYLYENKETGEVVEVLQSMSEVHEYHGTNGDQKGLWRRVFVNPNLSFDTNVDDTSSKSFVTSSRNKNYTYGELFEKSAEASEKRASKYGKDPIKQKQYADYKKKTNGKMHPQEMKERWQKTADKADKAGIDISL
jgi:hypothetical protein